MTLRLRKIVLRAEDFATLPPELDLLGAILSRRAGIPDLVVHEKREDGDRVQVFVHSESFAVESCCCRARLLELKGA